MSNEEITKALGLCFNINDNAGLNCGECPYKERTECSLNLYSDTIDLINRQQAEIKELKSKVFGMEFETAMHKAISERARGKAIKEFAEKLKAEHSTPDILMPFNWISIEDTALDQLVAEMVGAEE